MKKRISQHELSDIALFKQEVGSIEKIKQDKIQPASPTLPPKKSIHKKTIEQNINPPFSEAYEDRTIGSEESLTFRRSGIQHRLFSRLRNGHLQIEAELDLHGMTTPVAHHALTKFLYDCQQEQLRCVRIIHGKGWSSKNNKPVLKTKLNSWLQHDDDVLAFCSAPIEDGGTGAVYILLRRNKLNPNKSNSG